MIQEGLSTKFGEFTIYLHPEEDDSFKTKFDVKKAEAVVATNNWISKISKKLNTHNPSIPELIIHVVLSMIKKRVKKHGKVNYLQVASVDDLKFWVIDDGENAPITFLMPEDY